MLMQKPHLLIPYCFHLNLAMMAGGQMIKKMVVKAFSLPPNEGVHTFEMDVPNRGQFRKQFKEAVDTIPLTLEQRKDLLKESVQVFQRNNAVVKSHSGTTKYIIGLVVVICLAAALLLYTSM